MNGVVTSSLGFTSAGQGASVEEGGGGQAGGALRARADAVQVGKALARRLHDEAGPVAIHVLPASHSHLLQRACI